MLPGLHIFDLQDLTRCEILSNIKLDFENDRIKSISEYYSKNCNFECNEHHLIVYLETILHGEYSIDHRDISRLLIHSNSKTRKIALLLHYKHFPDIQSSSLQNDPSNSVREIYISQNKSLTVSSLIRQSRDENPSVKIQVLKRLVEFMEESRSKIPILIAVCYAISDRLSSVRICASKIIGYFKALPDDIIERLLDKQNAGHDEKSICGAFVYGIEDECLEVRMNTVRSLYSLTTAGVVSRVFDFLVDSLNDDDESLRELCIHYLRNLSKTYVLSVEQEIVNQICGSLDERSGSLKNNILELLSNLVYEDTGIFDILVSQMDRNVESRKIFECIRKIVSKNRKLFL